MSEHAGCSYFLGFPDIWDDGLPGAVSTFLPLPSRLRGVPDEDVLRLGERITAARARLRLTQQELADEIGVSVKTINNLETGRTGPPRPGTRTRLEDALGWSAGSIRTVLAGGQPTVTSRNSASEAEVDRSAVGGDQEGREPYLKRRRPEEPDLSNVSIDVLLQEVARRARDRNPDADR